MVSKSYCSRFGNTGSHKTLLLRYYRYRYYFVTIDRDSDSSTIAQHYIIVYPLIVMTNKKGVDLIEKCLKNCYLPSNN